MLTFLSFNRDQETEADILGTRLLADAGYDPHAAYEVWLKILAEEEAAAVKRRKPGLFSQTHPNSADRAMALSGRLASRETLSLDGGSLRRIGRLLRSEEAPR